MKTKNVIFQLVLAMAICACSSGDSLDYESKDGVSRESLEGREEARECRVKNASKKYSDAEYLASSVDKRLPIWTAKQFAALANTSASVGAHVILCDDIELISWYGAHPFFRIGHKNMPFHGSLNGNFKAIRNFQYENSVDSVDSYDPANRDVGIFGFIDGAEIFDLKVLDARIHTRETIVSQYSQNVGALFGYGKGSTISNILVSRAKITNDGDSLLIGGLCGTAQETELKNVEVADSYLEADSLVSGVCNNIYRATYSVSRRNTIIGSIQGSQAVSGFGNGRWVSWSMALENSTTGDRNVSGFGHFGILENVMATGTVRGSTYVGGIRSSLDCQDGGDSESIKNTYSNAKVIGDKYVGGHIGYYGDTLSHDPCNVERMHSSMTKSSVTEGGISKRNYLGYLHGQGKDDSAFYFDPNMDSYDPYSVNVSSESYFSDPSNNPMNSWQFGLDQWVMDASGSLTIPSAGFKP